MYRKAVPEVIQFRFWKALVSLFSLGIPNRKENKIKILKTGGLGDFLSLYRFSFRLGKRNLDIILVSILGMNLVNLVRGQTVYFIKNLIIMDSIPFILLPLFNNYILTINFRKS